MSESNELAALPLPPPPKRLLRKPPPPLPVPTPNPTKLIAKIAARPPKTIRTARFRRGLCRSKSTGRGTLEGRCSRVPGLLRLRGCADGFGQQHAELVE